MVDAPDRDHAIVVRRTFLGFTREAMSRAEEEEEQEEASRSRPKSLPPPASGTRGVKHDSQLERLNDVWSGRTQQPMPVGRSGKAAPTATLAEAAPSFETRSVDSLMTWTALDDLPEMDGGGDRKDARPRVLDEEQVKSVPLDADGRYTSLGSRGHPVGICSPCAFARSAGGCKFGIACGFCHFVDDHPAGPRYRPGKGKRARVKKAMASLEQRVAKDQELLSTGDLRLPKLVDLNPWARSRVMAQLKQMAIDEDTSAGSSSSHEGRAARL